jgi:hypothetical protein
MMVKSDSPLDQFLVSFGLCSAEGATDLTMVGEVLPNFSSTCSDLIRDQLALLFECWIVK